MKLVAATELPTYIAAEFNWELTSPDTLDVAVDLSNSKTPRAMLLVQFNIELTLTKRIHPRYESERDHLNEVVLTDAAFLPKNYTIRLEHGRFMDPAHEIDIASHKSRDFLFRPYLNALRLVFDKSPYPPQNEWKEGAGGIANLFADSKAFVDRRLGMDSYLTILLRKITKRN